MVCMLHGGLVCVCWVGKESRVGGDRSKEQGQERTLGWGLGVGAVLQVLAALPPLPVTHTTSLLLELRRLLRVSHRPLDEAHRLVHVALNPVNHSALMGGGRRREEREGRGGKKKKAGQERKEKQNAHRHSVCYSGVCVCVPGQQCGPSATVCAVL